MSSSEALHLSAVIHRRRTERPWLPVGVLLVPSAAGWALMIHWAGQMSNGAGPMGLDLWPFLGVWVVMMAAMMLPSLSVVRIAEGTPVARGLATATFAAAYLSVWAAVGILCYPLSAGFAALAGHNRPAAVASSVVLFTACAAYQCSVHKWRFLIRCQPHVPIAPLSTTYRQGVRCGANCLGASSIAMSLLFVLGFMQLEGMAIIAAALVVERQAKRRNISVLFGLGALAYGIAVAFHPSLAPALHVGGMGPTRMMK